MMMTPPSTSTCDVTKDTYLEKVNAQLNEWSAQVMAMKLKVSGGMAVHNDYHRSVADWQDKRASFLIKLDEIRSTETNFESLRFGAQRARNDLGILMAKISSMQK